MELRKKEAKEGNGSEKLSEDFILLERRMEHFLGLYYTEDTIVHAFANRDDRLMNKKKVKGALE